MHLGEQYLVYAHHGQRGLEVSRCNPPVAMAHANADLLVLGPGGPPLAGGATDNVGDAGATGFTVGIGLVLLFVAASLVHRLRRSRRLRRVGKSPR